MEEKSRGMEREPEKPKSEELPNLRKNQEQFQEKSEEVNSTGARRKEKSRRMENTLKEAIRN